MTAVRPKAESGKWDVVLTGILVVMQGLLAIAFVFLAQGLDIMLSSCTSSTTCNLALFQSAKLFTAFAPTLIAAGTIAWALVRVDNRKIGFWVPLLGAALMGAAFYAGSIVAFSA